MNIFEKCQKWGRVREPKKKEVLPGLEPGLREIAEVRIPCDNRYTIEP